ncbi:MAG: phosphatase PAP2 family protein [Bacteroidetes bacterium]|nr:phosphatase PAP2 family protein [Fibrella sp.]
MALFRTNRLFYVTYLIVLLATGGFMVLYSKDQLIRWVNTYNSVGADYFFDYATYLGDGAFFVLVIVILFFVSRRMGALALAAFSVSSLLSIFFKRVVFPNNFRPVKYFEHSNWEYHVIKGLKIYEYNSFPSGHTISAFTVFCLAALLDSNKNRGWLWVLLAGMVGYSRVYLFQHFVEDAFAGSIIGVLTSTSVYLAFNRWWPIETASA